VRVNEETLSRKEIEAVGPGGDYRSLAQPEQKRPQKKSPAGPESPNQPKDPCLSGLPARIIHRTQSLIKETPGPSGQISDETAQKIQAVLDNAAARARAKA
jgi:hypothetical protein